MKIYFFQKVVYKLVSLFIVFPIYKLIFKGRLVGKQNIPLKYGSLKFEKVKFEILKLDEKPNIQIDVNAGIYVLSPKMINLIRKNEYCDMPDLFIYAIRNKLELKVYPLHESWIDIGRPEDYKYLCEKEAILDE